MTKIFAFDLTNTVLYRVIKKINMQISEVSTHIDQPAMTTYKSVTISNGKQKWNFMKAQGKFNYISVCKMHSNPWNVLGKRFESFDQAQENYKSADVKTMILMAETTLN